MANHARRMSPDEDARRAHARQPQQRRASTQRRSTARHAAPRHQAPQAQRQRSAPPRDSRRLRPARPPKRSSIVLPLVAVLVGVAVLGLGGFLVVRSCSNGAQSGNTAQDAQGIEAVEQGGNAGTASASSPGSVDINLLMVGDMLFHYQVRMSGLQSDGSRNYDHLFTNVLNELANKDIKVINQETPLGGPIFEGSAPDGFDGYPEFNGPQEVGDAEVKAGFNVILKATNHAMDHSASFEDPYTLVKSEQEFWATKHPEVAVIGEVNPADENASVDDVYVYEKDGFKVALLNYTQDLNGNEPHDTQGAISMLEEEHVKATMAKARELADMIVVFPHWGEEYNLEPVDMQYEWAQLFVDEGADVIIGNHPHVFEPVTTYEGKDGKIVPCYWSTGNFVSTSPSNESLVGGIAEVTLRKEADGTCKVAAASFVPIVTHLGLSNDMTTYLLSDWTNDLAATNELHTDINDADNTGLTVEWANDFCREVLGSKFDVERSVLELDVTTAEHTSGGSSSSNETASSGTDDSAGEERAEVVEVEVDEAA